MSLEGPNLFFYTPCRCLIECRDEYKYNVEAIELLIRNHLVNMQQYDLHLAQVRSVSLGLERKLVNAYILTLFFFFFFLVHGERTQLHGRGIRHAAGEAPTG